MMAHYTQTFDKLNGSTGHSRESGKLRRENKKEKLFASIGNQIYEIPANNFSPSPGTSLVYRFCNGQPVPVSALNVTCSCTAFRRLIFWILCSHKVEIAVPHPSEPSTLIMLFSPPTTATAPISPVSCAQKIPPFALV